MQRSAIFIISTTAQSPLTFANRIPIAFASELPSLSQIASSKRLCRAHVKRPSEAMLVCPAVSVNERPLVSDGLFKHRHDCTCTMPKKKSTAYREASTPIFSFPYMIMDQMDVGVIEFGDVW